MRIKKLGMQDMHMKLDPLTGSESGAPPACYTANTFLITERYRLLLMPVRNKSAKAQPECRVEFQPQAHGCTHIIISLLRPLHRACTG